MDRFRKIVTDPFYAGVVTIDKQVKVENRSGLHTPLITWCQHLELVRIMNAKEKTQSGPRKNGNSKYPLSNLISCSVCKDKRNGRLVGFDHGNGKPNSTIVYEKYRCRSCGRYNLRYDIHLQIEKLFKDRPITSLGYEKLIQALDTTWKKMETEVNQEIRRIDHKIEDLNEVIRQQVEAVTDPSNNSIKQDILSSIERKKAEVSGLEDKLQKLKVDESHDKERFLRFCFNFVDNMGSNFIDSGIVSQEKLRCKQLMFPAGFWIDENKKVYTPEISPLITLMPKKKDAEASDNSHLVRVTGL